MKRVMFRVVVSLCLLAGCTGQAELTESPAAATPTAAATVPTVEATSPEQPGGPDAAKSEPVPYIPAGKPGSADDYIELITRLEQLVPAALRNEVPWPDLRNPNPIVAQIEIFNLWIWMGANLSEPQLVEVMAAPGSPSRELVVSVFGEIERAGIFEIRNGQQYEAFDHLVVTFESAGLPMWLARDVPADAVVIYYSDSSGPVDIVDQDTGAILEVQPGFPSRTWLSIMVPTDVGWLLWRDELIEPSDSELEVPDIPPPPGADEDQRTPEV